MTGKEAKSTKAAKQLEEDKQRRDGASEGDSFLSELGDIGNFDTREWRQRKPHQGLHQSEQAMDGREPPVRRNG